MQLHKTICALITSFNTMLIILKNKKELNCDVQCENEIEMSFNQFGKLIFETINQFLVYL